MTQVKEDRELMFVRNILCEIIRRTMEDATADESKIALLRNKEMVVSYKEDAIRFLKTKSFEGICTALGLNASRFRRKAYL
jgi:hypothetical protein